MKHYVVLDEEEYCQVADILASLKTSPPAQTNAGPAPVAQPAPAPASVTKPEVAAKVVRRRVAHFDRAAKYLSVSKSTLAKYCQEGLLTRVTCPGGTKFDHIYFHELKALCKKLGRLPDGRKARAPKTQTATGRTLPRQVDLLPPATHLAPLT